MLWSALRHILWVALLLLVLSLLGFVILLRDPLNANLVTQNIYIGYFHYLGTLLQGDFGITYNGGKSLMNLILTVLPPTLELCFITLFLAFIFGLPLGIISAVNSEQVFAKSLQSLSYVGLSIPIFWLAPFYCMLPRSYIGKLPLLGNIIYFTKLNPLQDFLSLICGLWKCLIAQKLYKIYYNI